ncbi:MAG: IDEAL domain-containing protein [Thermoflavifilum sp.]|nr:IDEAL domain-containing protein [Thermoflavifilum sp.]MCL6512979.1 IDEAL domain-containing protein [Alicyclobacillus sp.]
MTRVVIPKIGDWVSFYSGADGRIVTGYITDVSMVTRTCLVTVPATEKQHTVLLEEVVVETPELQGDDLRALIDLALDLHDEGWFRELTETMKSSCEKGAMP